MEDTLDLRDQRFESLFARWNLEFEFAADQPLDDMRVIAGAQVRNAEHIARKETVEEYAAQMKAGAQFPPIVIMKPNILIDGNTRLSAAKRNRMTGFPAYLVDCPTIDFAKALAATLNQMGGARLTADEAHQAALTMMGLRFNDEAIAREVGRSTAMVQRWRKLRDFEERTTKLGLEKSSERLSQNSKAVIAAVPHDPPFAEVVKLANEVRPEPKLLKQLVGQVKDAASDADALELVAEARREWKPVGPEPRSTQANLVAKRARLDIGRLVKIEPTDLFDPDHAENDRRRWLELRSLAEAVLALYADSESGAA